MQRISGAFAFLALTAACNLLSAAAICPTTASTNTDCGFIITIASNGSLSGVAVAGANAYDGADDVLIGVINNLSTAFNGTIHLRGSGNGGGLFAFDGDGICTFVTASYCTTAPTKYEGPLNRFANITTTTVASDTGDVIITGLAAGGTTFFSLESSPASITSGGGIIITGATPEPATVLLLGSSLIGLQLLSVGQRKRKTGQKIKNT